MWCAKMYVEGMGSAFLLDCVAAVVLRGRSGARCEAVHGDMSAALFGLQLQ